MEKLLIKKTEEALFERATDGDAGFDVVAVSEPKIVGQEVIENMGFYRNVSYIEYRTGIFLEPSNREFFLAYARSSISKTNLVLANSVGVIDYGYRGEVLLRFKYIFQPEDYTFGSPSDGAKVRSSMIYQKGDKIAQLVPTKLLRVKNIVEVATLSDSDRGDGGFGSTGK